MLRRIVYLARFETECHRCPPRVFLPPPAGWIDERATDAAARLAWPERCDGADAGAGLDVRVFFLPAFRLLRAAPGTRGDGRGGRCQCSVPAGDDPVLCRAGNAAGQVHPADPVHLHLRDHARAAAAVWLAGQPASTAGFPAGGVWLFHRHPAAVLWRVRQRCGRAWHGLLPVADGVQPVRGGGVLELHGRHLHQCAGQGVLRLHRRGRHRC